MIHELREFCEDNNVSPPGTLRSVPSRPELSFWSAGDPALENEAQPAVRLEPVDPEGPSAARVVYLQRVVYDLRYLLLDGSAEEERGAAPDLATALAVASHWLSGGAWSDLPEARQPVV